MIKLLTIALVATSVFAITSDEIIKRVDNNLQSDTGYSKIDMIMKTKRGTRTLTLESWNEGTKKSFMKILAPKKDKGITFLKIDTAMWQYVPRIQKTIKIPSSMMMSSWMGSDFTNDDMAKESSIIEDYDTKISNETASSYTLDLIPKEDAAVVWDKIVFDVTKENFVPLKATYFDEEGEAVRELLYLDVIKKGTRYFPTKWEMRSMDKPHNLTTILMKEVVFDIKLDSNMFTKRSLKRMSK